MIQHYPLSFMVELGCEYRKTGTPNTPKCHTMFAWNACMSDCFILQKFLKKSNLSCSSSELDTWYRTTSPELHQHGSASSRLFFQHIMFADQVNTSKGAILMAVSQSNTRVACAVSLWFTHCKKVTAVTSAVDILRVALPIIHCFIHCHYVAPHLEHAKRITRWVGGEVINDTRKFCHNNEHF